MARQLILDLPHRAAHGLDDFLVAPCNETAVAWIDRWPDWPNNALILHGPQGCGKSHLAEVWRTRTGARLTDGRHLSPAEVPELADAALVVDHANFTPQWETMFHLVNLMREEGKALLLLSRLSPPQWRIGLPDLRSRIGAMHAVAIGQPDDCLLRAVLLKLMSDRQMLPRGDIAAYVAARIERSFAAAGAVVAALDNEAMGEGRSVTVPLARKVLASLDRLGDDDA